MSKEIYLTGITTTGTPHLGNYVGAIKPAIEASKNKNNQCFYFLADYHALIKCQDPALVRQSRMEIAATWLALGLDVDTSVFYRQSDIPEIQELNWILSCVAAKGLLNRAHAYKALVAENETSGTKDPDKGITMGLFCYPVLMAADILMFNANKVPVGKDQIQHIEMTRDIAARFNHIYGEFFTLPEAQVEESAAVLSGLDGRKMSKSYNNTIPLFAPEKKLRKLIMKIKTNSLEPGEPKDHKTCTLFQIYSAFSSSSE
ncbi:MAG TPA: tryptophan--tRNA ligase, partial [Gammaproteobacteria bacterium]|nr:tryptophan--tRNA ligase [Gammaproteobacteria bacterium]